MIFETIQGFTQSKIEKAKPVHGFDKNLVAFAYKQYLTPLGFNQVHTQLQRRNPMTPINMNEDERTCLIKCGFCVIRAGIEECECSDYTSYQLPCRHIFAVRQHFNLPLFDRSLCHARMTREHNSLSILNNFANAVKVLNQHQLPQDEK